MGRAILCGLLTIVILGIGGARAAEPAPGRMVDAEYEEWRHIGPLLEILRAKHNLPALAAATIVDGRILNHEAVGVRKLGADVPVTDDDRFHIGSCTKAMTATLLEMLVERGQLKWSATLEEVFPEWAGEMNPAYRKVTLLQVMAHRAGLPGADKSWPEGMSFLDVHRLPGGPREQRLAYVRKILAQAPPSPPGEKFLYSNAGYSVLGVAAERAADRPWEDLLRTMLFEPLGMKSAGFGAMGSPGKVDQPWQHRVEGGKAVPVEPGPLSDNPAAIGPGGTVHGSVGDWAKFVLAHLQGARGEPTPLPIKDFRTLHEPPFGGDYAGGWGICERGWGGGRVLTHAGSNNMNYAVVWMAPKRNFAVVVATNQGGDAAAKACDETAAAVIDKYLTHQEKPK
jgi:CubicO group peptidase (beta-lactamase class C family)